MKQILAPILLFTIGLPATLGQSSESKAVGPSTSGARASAASVKRFSNEREKLNEKLKEKFVEFSLDYPDSWTLDSDGSASDETSFVTLHRGKPDLPVYQEFLSVASFSTDCPVMDTPKAIEPLSSLANQLLKVFEDSGAFEQFEKVSEGRTMIGKYRAYEARYRAVSGDKDKGPTTLWGRLVFIPGANGQRRGVSLSMFASALLPEIKGPADVGVNGELSQILASFRLSPPEADNFGRVPELRVNRIALGTDFKEVDKEKVVVNQDTVFPTDSPLAALWEAKHVRNGTTYKHIMRALETEDKKPSREVLSEKEETFTTDSPCGETVTNSFRLTTDKGWTPGKYSFDVYVNGKLERSIPFTIQR